MSSTVTYDTKPNGKIHVRLNGRMAGTIHHYVRGWYYRPRGSKVGDGDTFQSLEAVKRSLELEGFCKACEAGLTTTDYESATCTNCGVRLEGE